MTFRIEVVGDVGVDRCELLECLHSPEPEHGPLTSSEGQVTVLHSVVEPAANLPTIKISQFAHRGGIRSQAVSNDLLRPAVPLKRLLHERQSRGFVPFLGDVALQDFTLLVDRSPQVMTLAVDLHEHLVEMPFPLPEATHVVYPLPSDVGSKHRPEPVPPEPHCLVAEVNPALEKQVLDVPQAQRKTHVQHHHQTDHFG